MFSDNFRKDYSWQDDMVTKFLERLDEFHSLVRGGVQHAFTIEVSPSGGKSIGAMKLAVALMQRDLIDKVIFVVPRDSIKGGFKDDATIVKVPEKLRLPGFKSDHFMVDTALDRQYGGGFKNYHGAVITYQALPGKLEYFEMLSRSARLMFVFDEAHHGSQERDVADDAAFSVWGSAMHQVRGFAHAVICMSGTPVRSDNTTLPFWRYERVFEGTRYVGDRVIADFTFSYSRAIQAGVARRIAVHNVDPTITYEIADGDQVEECCTPLSATPRAIVPKVKTTFMSLDAGVVPELLRLADEANKRQRRAGDADAAILVVVESDYGGTDKLQRAKRLITKLFGDDDVVTVQSSDGDLASGEIKRFKKSTARWIVAKQMISEGTSIKRIRSIAILRNVTTSTFYQQLVHRATRNDSDDYLEDAFIVQFKFPDMFQWGRELEEISRLAVAHKPLPEINCRECGAKLEFRPSEDRPCPECGDAPEDLGGGSGTLDLEIRALFAEHDGEEIHVPKVGDVTPVWGEAGRIHERIGSRGYSMVGISEVLKAQQEVKVDDDPEPTLPGMPDEPSLTMEERFKLKWENGLAVIRSAAAFYCRRNPGAKQSDVIRKMTYECKRIAKPGSWKIESIMRDHPEPLDVATRFENAALGLRDRLKGKAA